MFVSELMQSDVVAIEPGNTLVDAMRMMISRHVSGLPVVENGRLVGIVAQGDLLRRAEIGTAGKKHWVILATLAKEDRLQSVCVVAETTPGLEDVGDHLLAVDQALGMAIPVG